MNAAQGVTDREYPGGKLPTELQSGMLILPGRHCQGKSCEICSHRMQFLWVRNSCSDVSDLCDLGRLTDALDCFYLR
jgi:hypothetical protein